MAINFTKNVEQYTQIQKGNSRIKHFVEFTSKKQLQNDSSLTNDELDFVLSIKGTFSFALHEDGRYMAVTIYRANAEKKYNFLVLDLKEEAIAEVESIKTAKAEIMELVLQNKLTGIVEEELAKNADAQELAEDDEQFTDEAEDIASQEPVVEESAVAEEGGKKKSKK